MVSLRGVEKPRSAEVPWKGSDSAHLGNGVRNSTSAERNTGSCLVRPCGPRC